MRFRRSTQTCLLSFHVIDITCCSSFDFLAHMGSFRHGVCFGLLLVRKLFYMLSRWTTYMFYEMHAIMHGRARREFLHRCLSGKIGGVQCRIFSNYQAWTKETDKHVCLSGSSIDIRLYHLHDLVPFALDLSFPSPLSLHSESLLASPSLTFSVPAPGWSSAMLSIAASKASSLLSRLFKLASRAVAACSPLRNREVGVLAFEPMIAW
jgi:hypothetical protein